MRLNFRKKIRLVVIVLSCMFFMLGGSATLDMGMEAAGTLMVTYFFGIIAYSILVYVFGRIRMLSLSESWKKMELFGLLVALGFLSVIGIPDSYPKSIFATLVFVEILAFVILFSFLILKYTDVATIEINILKKWGISRVLIWAIGTAYTALLPVLIAYDYEPLLSITVFFYFLILFILGIAWLVRQTKTIIQLKNEKAKTELVHLQSQVNPHFFFNVLNNLYGLVKQDANQAQNLILKLSDMMRYSIYEGQKDLVNLADEVSYLNNFIELHKMRYKKTIDVEFVVDISEEEILVMPLMFVILLENAFKHGVEKLRNNAYIHMNLSAQPGKINCSIENNFDPSEQPEKNGIGIQNLRRRLQLVYPNQHVLSFSESNNIYKAELSLTLL